MTTNECKTKCQKLKSDWKQVQRNALTIITMQTATQQHDSLKVQGIDALIAFFWFGSRLTRCPFPPQQHLFFTSHEAKETDVASFVKVILGDWVHWREGEESVKKEETKKKNPRKKHQSQPPPPSHLPAGLPLTPPSSGRQTEPRGAADEAERGVCPRPPPGLGPPSVHHLARWEEFGRREPHTESGVIYDVCMQSLPVWFDLPRRCAPPQALLLARWLCGLHKGRVIVSFLLKSRSEKMCRLYKKKKNDIIYLCII